MEIKKSMFPRTPVRISGSYLPVGTAMGAFFVAIKGKVRRELSCDGMCRIACFMNPLVYFMQTTVNHSIPGSSKSLWGRLQWPDVYDVTEKTKGKIQTLSRPPFAVPIFYFFFRHPSLKTGKSPDWNECLSSSLPRNTASHWTWKI